MDARVTRYLLLFPLLSHFLLLITGYYNYGPREYDILPSNIQAKTLQNTIQTEKKFVTCFIHFGQIKILSRARNC